ncbi:hypothetical protein BGZ60DRAFT_395197 [Tricladium varicosporioides]|nr:hypothetical protein BGZ60DRAFT_395197 [Hymenoscyphus varicosporioides]
MTFASVDGIALVTGAGAGIGAEIGYAFAEAGALGVVFADLNHGNATANSEKSKEFAINPNFRSLSIQVDVTNPGSVQAMVDLCVKEFSRIDYFVHSAGVGATSLAPTADLDIENFENTLSVNARGTMLCVRAVSKAMAAQKPRSYKGRHGQERTLGRGCIINIGSVMSHIAGPGMMAYAASKHALLGITKVAALDNAKNEIRVNALCPSWVATPMLERSIGRWAGLEGVIAAVSPAKRPAFPEEVANMAVFMCSPSATYVNGTGLIIDAGLTVTVNA